LASSSASLVEIAEINSVCKRSSLKPESLKMINYPILFNPTQKYLADIFQKEEKVQRGAATFSRAILSIMALDITTFCITSLGKKHSV
jgi:hypothetical protein